MGSIQLKSVKKSFGAVNVINDVNLNIENGEFAVFVGPSGCGKSTLLRLIAGLEDVTSGQVLIDAKDMTNVGPAQRGLAMVFQSYALYPHMNVRKNMTFGLKFTGVPPAERERRVAEAARMLRLEELLERYPRDLSGGQRQRVAIGRAIVREPAVFLFDEPLSNLDAALRVSTRVEIANLHRVLKATIVYVTHDQVEAMTLADRIVVMNKGCIEQVGKPLELYYAPANLFVAGFIGSPAMNFFEAKVERIEGGCARVAGAGFRSFDLPTTSLKVGDVLTVGVRPEHLARGTDGVFAVEGVVELVERLGESSFAYLRRADGRLFVAEVRGRQTPTPGERTTLTATTQDVHVFDASGFRVSMQNNS